MSFDGAAGRLVELRQRQRRAQFETARTLLLRDGDGGQKASSAAAGLAGSRFSSISPRTRCSSASNLRSPVPLARRKRFVEDGEGAVDVAGPGFSLGKSNFGEPLEDPDFLFA